MLDLREVEATLGSIEKLIGDSDKSKLIKGIFMNFLAEAYLDNSSKYDNEMKKIIESRKRIKVD